MAGKKLVLALDPDAVRDAVYIADNKNLSEMNDFMVAGYATWIQESPNTSYWAINIDGGAKNIGNNAIDIGKYQFNGKFSAYDVIMILASRFTDLDKIEEAKDIYNAFYNKFNKKTGVMTPEQDKVLRKYIDTPEYRYAQEFVAYVIYYRPVVRYLKNIGITNCWVKAALFDISIQHGESVAKDMIDKIHIAGVREPYVVLELITKFRSDKANALDTQGTRRRAEFYYKYRHYIDSSSDYIIKDLYNKYPSSGEAPAGGSGSGSILGFGTDTIVIIIAAVLVIMVLRNKFTGKRKRSKK